MPDAQKKKRLRKKQLAKTNKKMTMFLKAPMPEMRAIQLVELENTMLLDDATLERKRIVATKDGDWGNRRMVTRLLRDIFEEVPGLVEAKDIVDAVFEASWTRVASREVANKEVAMVMEHVLEKAWWNYMVEDMWKMLANNKELQRIMSWRMTNQRKDENMLAKYLERQERLQRREMAQRRWREQRSLVEEPMEIGVKEDWQEMEIHEHKAMELMMMNLGIIDDMELGEGYDDEMLVAMDFDEESEHSYLDRMLQELDVGTAADMEDMLECKDKANFGYIDDTQASHAGAEDILSVSDGSDNMASGCIQMDTSAYMNAGTWWLNNWVTNTGGASQVGIQTSTCKNKLGCTCSSELGGMSTPRILKPVTGDCTLGRVCFKRSRNEPIVWSVSGTQRLDSSRSRRGSLPRKWLPGRRRKPSQTEDHNEPPEVSQDNAPIISDTISNAGKLFGGSGAKFASLRNRRGVRGGEDGRFQTKLILRVSNDGNGKFSLFPSGVEGVRAGKRSAEDEENTSDKKKMKL